jgi:hypothetical protein
MKYLGFFNRKSQRPVEGSGFQASAETRPPARKIGGAQRGVAVVESAFILLLFFVLLLGMMEAGRFFQVQQVLTDAAREGARLAVAPYTQTSTLPSDAEIRAEVQRFTRSANINVPDGNIQIDKNFNCIDGNVDAHCTEVVVISRYRLLTLAMFSDLAIDLRGRAVMRNETSP